MNLNYRATRGRKKGRLASEQRDRQFTTLILIQKEKYLSGKAYSHKDEKLNFREIPFIKYSSWKECKHNPLLSHLKTERNCPKIFRYKLAMKI